MAKVSFFTPIDFGNQTKSFGQRLLEKVDDYFYLGGKKAIVLDPIDAVAFLIPREQSLLKTCLKVASYFTIFLPIIPLINKTEYQSLAKTHFIYYLSLLVPIMLLTKVILRYIYSYEDAYTREKPIKKPSQPTTPSINHPDKTIKPLAHQPIDLSVIDTLGLNLDEACTVDASKFSTIFAPYIPTEPLTLRQAATEVITEINKAIQEKTEANPQVSIEEKHNIVLKAKAPWEGGGSNLHFYEQYCPSPSSFANNEQLSKVWLNRILNALVDKNYIQFKTTSRGNGYLIQV
jgi:hypothetical protein